jgi:hypothetical protein
MFAKVILASKPTNGAPPIITIHARSPRIIHGEIMTHRVFSRNARSSRAVPVATMLKEIRETPFVPWHWGKNQKGMQAGGEHNELIGVQKPMAVVDFDNGPEIDYWVDGLTREDAWLKARDNAVELAGAFSEAGYHKQIVNRLIEPFSWIDTLITSTSWANFFHLRDHDAAEPHFHDLAMLVREAIAGAEFQTLEPGQWHLPYANWTDTDPVREYLHSALDRPPSPEEYQECYKKLSVARCARISYKPFDGDGSIEKELERYEMLVGSSPLHASPAEHQATPDNLIDTGFLGVTDFANAELAGNLGKGWIQYRKMLPGEYVPDGYCVGMSR